MAEAVLGGCTASKRNLQGYLRGVSSRTNARLGRAKPPTLRSVMLHTPLW